MTSHRGSGFHGPEGVRQAGMPGVSRPDYPAGRCGRRGGRMSPALLGAGDMGPADGATDTVTGAEAQEALRRLMPRDQAGSSDHPY